MFKLLLVLFLLVSSCVAIHGAGMIFGIRRLRNSWPRLDSDFALAHIFWLLVRVVYGLLLLHLVQILVWSAFYQMNGCFPDFATSFYFSAASYSTVGYGDVVLGPQWRILGAIEAVTGVLMFGWSTGVLFTLVHHLHSHYFRLHIPQRHPEAGEASGPASNHHE